MSREVYGLLVGQLADRFADRWRLERRFEPSIKTETRSRKLAGWRSAVVRL